MFKYFRHVAQAFFSHFSWYDTNMTLHLVSASPPSHFHRLMGQLNLSARLGLFSISQVLLGHKMKLLAFTCLEPRVDFIRRIITSHQPISMTLHSKSSSSKSLHVHLSDLNHSWSNQCIAYTQTPRVWIRQWRGIYLSCGQNSPK